VTQQFIDRSEKHFYYDESGSEIAIHVVLEEPVGHPNVARRIKSAMLDDARKVTFATPDQTALVEGGTKLYRQPRSL
jgi:hypothetical protein